MRHRRNSPFGFLAEIAVIGLASLMLIGRYSGDISTMVETVKTECTVSKDTEPSSNQTSETHTGTSGDLEVHFIDVGQGDSTLIECDGEYMLIDAGQNDKGLELWNYLAKQGATHLKYAIGTHPDADHIGGLDVVLYRCDVDLVMMPDLEKDTRTYDDVIQVIKNRTLKKISPEVGAEYSLGSATFTIVAPNKDYGTDDANDWSIGILLQNGNDRFLFVGDAEEEAESDMLQNGIDISADVYKVAHHGSNTGTTQEFLDAVSPTYAVISCGEGNSYGHPHQEVLDKLKAAGTEVFRTDEQGTIIARSDGNGITWNTDPSETWLAGNSQ